jgi:hypothetical protein
MGRKKVGYHQANTRKKYLIDLVGFDKKKKKKKKLMKSSLYFLTLVFVWLRRCLPQS